LEFAVAYFRLACELGKVEALDYFVPPPGGRSGASRVVRETPKKLDQFFSSPPEKAIGVVMHVRGDLVFPRFSAEAGMHVVKEKKSERLCLIEVAQPPFADYEAPAGIDRQGAIKARGTPLRRIFEREKNLVKDTAIGERPWSDLGLTRCVAALIEDRLNRDMEAMTQ
jgi:hypothetical protein